eukprot:117938-Pelagomonas_calceolata.AAC.1
MSVVQGHVLQAHKFVCKQPAQQVRLPTSQPASSWIKVCGLFGRHCHCLLVSTRVWPRRGGIRVGA